VRWSELVSAAEQVKGMSGKVTIVARTRSRVRRFDPLDLTLTVTPPR
jgi:hypothetical protein